MARKANKHGGGAQTNVNGLAFEQNSSIIKMIKKQTNHIVNGNQILDNNGKLKAEFFEKHTFYKDFLVKKGVNWETVISAKLLPDSVLVVGKKVYIIEMKYQNTSGSVAEKLQTCDFKKKQYEKLCKPIGYKVEYIYLLNDWFNQKVFDDVFKYINSVGCSYHIGALPLNIFSL